MKKFVPLYLPSPTQKSLHFLRNNNFESQHGLAACGSVNRRSCGKCQKNRLQQGIFADDTQNMTVILYFPSTMRWTLWLILIFAFSVGMCGAFACRFFYFDAQPAAAHVSAAKTKILVAKQTIPGGVEITADTVIFQEVAASEVPPGSLVTFAQVYRRKPAYPISAGCPICEDLLIPYVEVAPPAFFVPVGSQLVELEVVHVRQGDKIAPLKKPLSTLLSSEQRVDIRVIPHEPQGKLAEKKNEVLRTFAVRDSRNSGELVLANVPISQIQRLSFIDNTGSAKDSLSFILDKSEAAKLEAAAKKGQIRIIVRQESEKMIPKPAETANVFDIATQTPLLSDILPFEQPLFRDIPSALEQPPTIHQGVVQGADPVLANDTDQISSPLLPAPVPASASECAVQLPVVSEIGISQNHNRLAPLPSHPVVSALPEEKFDAKISIRNDYTATPFGQPSILLEPPRTMEQTPALVTTARMPESLPRSEPEQESLNHSYPEAVMGVPRITGTLKFLPIDRVTAAVISTKESLQAPVKRAAPAATPPKIQPKIQPEFSPSMSANAPMPVVIQTEKAPAYSPWERRAYTVQPSKDWGNAPVGNAFEKNVPEEGLLSQPRLLRKGD